MNRQKRFREIFRFREDIRNILFFQSAHIHSDDGTIDYLDSFIACGRSVDGQIAVSCLRLDNRGVAQFPVVA